MSQHSVSFLPFRQLPAILDPPKISDLSVGVWAMKSVFYGLDPDNTGFVRLEDILIGAARDRWLERALTPTGFLGNAKKFDKGVRLRAATRGEAGSNGACTTMMTGLRESGIDGGGAHHRVGADGDTDRDGGSCDLDLVHFVRHLLVPLASLLKDVRTRLNSLFLQREDVPSARCRPSLLFSSIVILDCFGVAEREGDTPSKVATSFNTKARDPGVKLHKKQQVIMRPPLRSFNTCGR